ncbi:MAG: family 10 glycosylhydrolase [Clostridia bacterium]|nr:family 10 glycosylhydrolase [Clostridia bacterium]
MKAVYTKVIYLILGLALLTSCAMEPPSIFQESSNGTLSENESSSRETAESFVSEVSKEEPEESSYEEESGLPSEETMGTYVKAVWLSQYDMMSVYTANGKQRSAQEYLPLVKQVLENVAKDGYNTVIVQVRPFGDSMYPSELYPPSRYASGSYGQELTYDPFELLITEAKALGLSVHAWINPMRLMKSAEIKQIGGDYLITQWYEDSDSKGDKIVEVDGRWYLNPAHEEVRELIADGAREICERYAVDGVHMDDYFYPTTNASFDKLSYDAYKAEGGTLSLSKFRYENINAMVREIYAAVKSVNEDLLFGISPMGNLQQGYETLYTDVYTWCKEDGYIDYICPQIYFGLEHQTHDFKSVYRTWKSILKNDNVTLWVGMTLGKAQSGVDNYAGSGKDEWKNHKDVLKRCLEYLEDKEDCTGVVMFCYQYMYDPVTGKSVSETLEERNNLKDALEALGDS